MRLSSILLLLLAGHACGAGLKEVNPPREPQAGQTLALVGARLIDGRGGAPVDDSVVVIGESAILAAGARDTIDIPQGATRLSVAGLTIVPGLIDSHLHTVNNLHVPARFLAHGVTAFRDPGHPFRFYQALMQTDKSMPRAFLTGAHLDAYPPIWPQQAVLVKDVDHARRAVTEHVDRGASAIKIYFRLPLDLYRPVCETARQRGVLVTAHLELVDADDAIRAGVRGIEHTTSFGTALAAPDRAAQFKAAVGAQPDARRELRYRLWANLDLNTAKTRSLIDLIVQQKVFVSPTLAVFERRAGKKNATEVHARGFDNMLRFVGMCHSAGATVVVGSHTNAPFAESGWAYQRELELLVEAGLTPLEAIEAGTLDNAHFFGAEDRIGSIEPGKLADLAIVAGNPAKNIRDMYNVHHVMLNGTWVTESPKIEE